MEIFFADFNNFFTIITRYIYKSNISLKFSFLIFLIFFLCNFSIFKNFSKVKKIYIGPGVDVYIFAFL